jgi:hypothetical protein
MARKLLFFFVVCYLQISLSFAQVTLSNDFNNLTKVSVNNSHIPSDFILENTFGKDIEIPSCSKMYQGISSYFSFVMPESGISSVVVEFPNDFVFGISAYLITNNAYKELECAIFTRSNKGIITIGNDSPNSIAGDDILVRVWVLNKTHEGLISIGIYERPNYRKDKLMEYTIIEKIEILENSHKQFIDLPYPKEYIYNSIFPEIQDERTSVAPNFPIRGNNNSETMENQIYWLENHSDEFYFYIDFLNRKFHYYKNKADNK